MDNISAINGLRSQTIWGANAPLQTIPETAFGKAKWERYFGDVGDEPPLPDHIANILQSPCPFWPGRRVEETHFLVLIPHAVNGVPLTFNTLRELIKNQRFREPVLYFGYLRHIKKEVGNYSLPSHWILMTKEIIPNSNNKKFQEQKALVAEYSRISGRPLSFPKALEAAIGLIANYMETGELLYSEYMTKGFIRCEEEISNRNSPENKTFMIIFFHEKGLSVASFADRADPHCGTCGLWRFLLY